MSQSSGEKSPDSKLPWDPDTAMVRVADAMTKATRAYEIRMANLLQAVREGTITGEQFTSSIMEELRERNAASSEAAQKILDEYAD